MGWLRFGNADWKDEGVDPIGPPLTEEKVFQAMGGVFDADEIDHKCGKCWARVILVPGDDIAACTIVKDGVSLGKGSCNYFDAGEEPSKPADMSKKRMSWKDAGYIETPTAEMPIVCGTCNYFQAIDEKRGSCLLWMGTVATRQCCQAWESHDAKTPEHPHMVEESTAPSTAPGPSTPPGTPPPPATLP
jgi:hypothetical protein